MSHPTVSLFFALVFLAVSVSLTVHMVYVLWKNRSLLQLLKEGHNSLVHSLPMSLGMISTMTVCTITGAVFSHSLSFAYVSGLLIGVSVSGLISFPIHDIAIVDGVVAGAMGGLMGTMLGVMVPLVGLYLIILLLTAVFGFSWLTMNRRLLNMEVTTSELSTMVRGQLESKRNQL